MLYEQEEDILEMAEQLDIELPEITDAKHLSQTMDHIVSMTRGYELRRRMNPHHTDEQKSHEKVFFEISRAGYFLKCKAYFTANRDGVTKGLIALNSEDILEILNQMIYRDLNHQIDNTLGGDDAEV